MSPTLWLLTVVNVLLLAAHALNVPWATQAGHRGLAALSLVGVVAASNALLLITIRAMG